jgi:hypothetical protein
MAAGQVKKKPDINLETIPQEQLLDTRICDLPVKIEGTWLEPRVAQLHEELQAKNILYKPRCYLADEWLTPEDEPVIGIPFYLAHPRLIVLETEMMLEAEGDDDEWCMKLLRHEAGHALSYAYGLHYKRSWQRVFGLSSQKYDDTYRFRPYSKSYVRHLDNYYAQYHPDEDFCETFAVWLTPDLDWREEYEGWKALDKLLFVDRLMKSIAGRPPLVSHGKPHWAAAEIRGTLRRYYRRRRSAEAENYPDFHDANLRQMFTEGQARHETRTSVASILKTHRKALLNNISEWTGERKYRVDEVFQGVYQRCRALRLVTEESESQVLLKLTTYLTTLQMNYRYTNRLRGTKV